MLISIPKLALVVLIGPSSSGKSTFARRHFLATEIVSSDFCRAVVSDDENSLEATTDAFDLLHVIAEKRLRRGLLTVVDATNVQPEGRKQLVELARRLHVMPVAIAFDLPDAVLFQRHEQRTDRSFATTVITRQRSQLRRSLRLLDREGFKRVAVLRGVEEVESASIQRERLWVDQRHEAGPFDIIGDVHGCADELEALLARLGYAREAVAETDAVQHDLYPFVWRHPAGRRAVFVGDLVDRGPRILHVVELVRHMVVAGTAFAVAGNHDAKVARLLGGRNVKIAHGLEQTVAELEALPEAARPVISERHRAFLNGLVGHYVLDGGGLVVAHAGLHESMHGRASAEVRAFAMFGETTGEIDEFGLPVRYNWALDYRGRARVVYGHTPIPRPEWLNNTVNLDTGCVFGGELTALRWPEFTFASVPAARVYAEPIRPIAPAAETHGGQQEQDRVLDIADFMGKRVIETRLSSVVTVPAENATAALEIISRFAIDSRWLLYLPPTMSPSETSKREGLLEHPDEAFAYFKREGVERLVCQEKHMGSRACLLVFRDAERARARLGVEDGRSGVCYTRTGRAFFGEEEQERAVVERLARALGSAGIWDSLNTDWVLLDCELMPWSVKAQQLLTSQYASVGTAARHSLSAAQEAINATAARVANDAGLAERFAGRAEHIARYNEAYARYCWATPAIDDLRLAPFHILASEGAVHVDRDHIWHMETIAAIVAASGDPLLHATAYRSVEVDNPASVAEGVAWWEELTAKGGEGMVVKPLEFVARSRGRLAQPAVKCRGQEYLRIIYGPEYLVPENLERLRARSVNAKRALAAKEFALGIEGLERFVRREPLRRVHECVHAVLALESEPVDPRL